MTGGWIAQGEGQRLFSLQQHNKRRQALPMSEAEKAGGGGSGDFGHLLDRDSADVNHSAEKKNKRSETSN